MCNAEPVEPRFLLIFYNYKLHCLRGREGEFQHMRQRRISNSPLIDPLVSALVVFMPTPEPPCATAPTCHDRARAAAMQAASIMDVPVFILSRTLGQQQPRRSVPHSQISLPQSFLLEDGRCPWADGAFVEALANEDRSILLFAGVWLEHQVLGTALHALAEGYDVCVLLDATPARSEHATAPARERLGQAGATPVVTSQVIHEWMLEAPDQAKQNALQALFADVMHNK